MTYVRIYVLYVCMHVMCMYVCMHYAVVYVSVYICINVCVYVCNYVHMCMHNCACKNVRRCICGQLVSLQCVPINTASFEIHPSRTTMTFPIRGLTSMSSATIALVDLYPVTRAPFPVICRGTENVILGEMSAADNLDPSAQPKIYTADVTACLRAAHEAGMDEFRIEMALPCHRGCFFAEAPFLVLQ